MDKITQLMVITMEECGELTQVCSKLLRKRHTNNEISKSVPVCDEVSISGSIERC